MNVILWMRVSQNVINDMIEVAPLLRRNSIKTEDAPSWPLDKGVPELVDIQLIPPPFFQCSGSSMTNKPRSTSLAKTTSNLPMRQTSFFFLAKILVRRPPDLPDLLRRHCFERPHTTVFRRQRLGTTPSTQTGRSFWRQTSSSFSLISTRIPY